MKYVIAAIGLVAVGLFIGMAVSGHTTGRDLTMLGVAIVLVCFFGALPVVLGARRGRGEPSPPVIVKAPPKDGDRPRDGGRR
ncbi:hypothetical protein PHYC_03215 [Phycisphaerales bacterium]|nr:hypothetical protein PHYC_03215 [Phycisphaerales bacterium]